jgi:hypothetical protein
MVAPSLREPERLRPKRQRDHLRFLGSGEMNFGGDTEDFGHENSGVASVMSPLVGIPFA